MTQIVNTHSTTKCIRVCFVLLQALRSSPALQDTFTSGVWLHPLLPDGQPGVRQPLPPHMPLQRHTSALQRVRDEAGQPCTSAQRTREQRVSDRWLQRWVGRSLWGNSRRVKMKQEILVCYKIVVCFQVVPLQSVPCSGWTHADACSQGRRFLGAKTQWTQLLRHFLQVEKSIAITWRQT